MRGVRGRLVIIQMVVLAMLLLMAGRLWQVQVLSGAAYVKAAEDVQKREVVVPAVRGEIRDVKGEPLVRNRSALVVSVDRPVLERLPDKGEAVLARLAKALGTPAKTIKERIRSCGPGVGRPCWPGSPYQPIPITGDRVDPDAALPILERREKFPGVTAEIQAVRDYPLDRAAAQMVGYLQPVTQEELARREGLKDGFSGVDLVGRAGLESEYDEELRGTAGEREVTVDRNGRVLGTRQRVAPETGDTLVTSIDGRVQKVVEKALDEAVSGARKRGDPADGAAGVVLDVRTGRVVAMASRPTYDPAIWTGGISGRQYDRLLSAKAGNPLISRATNGQFAPGSTFKVSSLSAAVEAGYKLHGRYGCPGSYRVGDRNFSNFRGRGLGTMSLETALIKSCDTIFYRFAHEMWLRAGGTKPRKKAPDPMPEMARAFGFGRPSGIDLAGESAGRIPDRKWKRDYWEQTRDAACKSKEKGLAGRIARETCTEGHVWRPGDAANLSIGQGDVLVTPLQLAVAYAAVAGDGTLWRPTIGKALVRPDGTKVRDIKPERAGRLPIDATTRKYIRRALSQVPQDGTAAGAFGGFPFEKVNVGGKTGTAEVFGKKDTSWFASFAPADKPRYAVVAMVSQGGLGSEAAAPAVRKIYEGIYDL